MNWLRTKLPVNLTIHNAFYYLDGGTTTLCATDEVGRERVVKLIQAAFPGPKPSSEPIPGRLYFDAELIPIRSNLESNLLGLLRTSHVWTSNLPVEQNECVTSSTHGLVLGDDLKQLLNCGPEEKIQFLLARVINFVESDEYLRIADRVEMANDNTRYTAWIMWDPANRKQVIVRTAMILGEGVKSVREMLENGKPLAENTSALEMSELLKRYGAEGIFLRVEPKFRWDSEQLKRS